MCSLAAAKHRLRLGRALFLLSTDLDKILHTSIVVRNTLVGRLRP